MGRGLMQNTFVFSSFARIFRLFYGSLILMSSSFLIHGSKSISNHYHVLRETCNGAPCPPKSYCRQYNGNQEKCQCVEKFYKKGQACFEADAACDVQLIVRIPNFVAAMSDSGSKNFNELEDKFTHAVDTILRRTYQREYKEALLISVNSVTTMQKVVMKIMFDSDGDTLPQGIDVETILNKFIRTSVADVKIETLEMKPPCEKLQSPPSVSAIVARPLDTSAKIEWTFKSTLNVDQITLFYGIESEDLSHYQTINMSNEQSAMELTDLKPSTTYVVYVNSNNKVGKGTRKMVRFTTMQALKTEDPQTNTKTTVIIICGIVIASFILIAVGGFILLRRDETGEMIIKKIIRKRKKKKSKKSVSIEKVKTAKELGAASPASEGVASSDPSQPPTDYYYDDYYYNDYAYETIPVPLDGTAGSTLVENESYGAEGAKYDDYYYDESGAPALGVDASQLNPAQALNGDPLNQGVAQSQVMENIPLDDIAPQQGVDTAVVEADQAFKKGSGSGKKAKPK